MEIITQIIVYNAGFYLFLSFILTFGLIRITKKTPGIASDKDLLSVTVIIPARNEEKNIERCLDSIANVDYAEEKLRVIFVDDHSTDNTVKIAETAGEKLNDFTLIKMSDFPDSGAGKLGALIQGYKAAESDIILQTDADCVVPENWIKTMTGHFDKKTGIVGGITIMEDFGRKNSYSTQVQSLDWIYLLGVGVGAAGIGVPLSCIGNNLAVRRAAYQSCGGYEKIPFSLTEDFALFKAITSSGWKSAFSVKKESLVMSAPPETFSGFLQQRMRWTAGGLKLAGPGVILLAASFVTHLVVPAGLIFGLNLKILAGAFLITAAGDFMFLFTAAKKLKSTKLLKYFPLFEVYYYLYTTLFGILLPFFQAVTWKGRDIKTK